MRTISWLGTVQFPVASARQGYEISLGKMLQSQAASSSDVEVPYLRSASVQWSGVEVDDAKLMWASPREIKYFGVRPGDLLVCEGGDVGRAAIFEGARGFIIQNSLHRIRARGENDVRFFRYVLEVLHGSSYLDVLCNKATIRHLTGEKLKALEIPLPSIDEQRRVADFLDVETAREKQLRSSLQRLLVLLDEREKVCLTDCVAGRRVKGARKTHPVLGELPGDWPILPLRRVVPRVGVGVVVNPSSYFSEEGVPFLRGSNVQEGRLDLTDVKLISRVDSNRLWRSRLSAGDVVVVRAGDPGRAAVVPPELDGGNCASILILKAGGPLVPDYIAAFFNSALGRGQVQSVRYGAAQEQINVGHVVEFPIPVPSAGMQQSLLETLAEETAAIAKLRLSVRRQLGLLEDRRRSLLAAAVTGEFDVTTARGMAV